VFATLISFGAVGLCFAGLFGDYWMKNTTIYTDATIGDYNFFDANIEIHLNPRQAWISTSLTSTYGSQPVETDVTIDFNDPSLVLNPSAQKYNAVASKVTLLMWANLALTSMAMLVNVLLARLLLTRKPVDGVRYLAALLCLVAFGLPVGSIVWWSMVVANPADIFMVSATYQVSMTIDGDMGWSSVLPLLGGSGMFVAFLCQLIYLPVYKLPLDASLNNEPDYARDYRRVEDQDPADEPETGPTDEGQ